MTYINPDKIIIDESHKQDKKTTKNIIINPFLKFKRSNLSVEEIVELYGTRENKRVENTKHLLENNDFLSYLKWTLSMPSKEMNSVFNFIKLCTLNTTTEEDIKDEFLKLRHYFPEFVKYLKHSNHNSWELETRNGSIYFMKILDMLPELRGTCYDTIETEMRYGKCHSFVRGFAPTLLNCDIDSYACTAWCYTLLRQNKFLHSWVEATDDNGMEIVFDGTIGAVINKDAYYKMLHPKQIEKIDARTIEQDEEKQILKNLSQLDENHICSKIYYHNRKEALRIFDEMQKGNPDYQIFRE